MAEQDTTPESLLTRVKSKLKRVLSWSNEHRLKAGLSGLGAVLLLLAMSLLLKSLLKTDRELEDLNLDSALEALDKGFYDQARNIVDQLSENKKIKLDDLGTPAYILGALEAYQAESAWADDFKLRKNVLASRYLEDARDRGFPPGREPEGLYLLGRSLVRSRQYAAALPILNNALKLNPNKKSEIYQLLYESYYLETKPEDQLALKFNTLYLSDQLLPTDSREQAYVVRAQLMLRQKNLSGAMQAIQQIPEDSKKKSAATVLNGRLLMQQANQLKTELTKKQDPKKQQRVNELYQEAIKLFGLSQVSDTTLNRSTPKSMYLIGVCYDELGDLKAALKQFELTHKLYYDTPAGFAATIKEVNLLRRTKADDKAITLYRRILKQINDPAKYQNQWIPLAALQNSILVAYQDFLKRKKYSLAIELSKAMPPLLPKIRSMQLSAEVNILWAEQITASAPKFARIKTLEMKKVARAKLREAGNTYAKISQIRIATNHYQDDLWLAAYNLSQGQDYKTTALLLTKYLDIHHRANRPAALTAVGTSYLAMGKTSKAIRFLKECIDEYPTSSASYRARIVASKAFLKHNNLPEAVKLLEFNIIKSKLTPASSEWTDSLFALGELYHFEGSLMDVESRKLDYKDLRTQSLAKLDEANRSFGKAITNLDEAIERYPTHSRAILAEYLLAESYWKRAKLPRRKLDEVTIETTRLALNQKMHRDLDQAKKHYKHVQNHLNKKQEIEKLSMLDNNILRNCYFAEGGILFDAFQYDQAIVAYSAAANRYGDSPEALNAFFQIASCQRRLGKRKDAKGTLKRAKVVLDRMNTSDSSFPHTTNYKKEEWKRLLDWLIEDGKGNLQL